VPISSQGRDAWGWRWLEDLAQDVRFGLRMLRNNRGFTIVAVLTLALGIGVNTAIFSIVDAVLLRPLPYKGADRLVAVWATEVGQPDAKIFATYRDFQEFRANSSSFEELAALTWARAGEILSWNGTPHEVLAIPASAEFFSLLGISAGQGRTFGREDLQNGCTVVLAHSFWQSELGAPSDISGKTLTLNGRSCLVAGVMPAGFDFYPKETSLWTLITPDSAFAQRPLDSVVGIFGRLRPGVSLAGAEVELAALHQRIVKESPAGSWVAQITPIVRDLREQFTWMAGRNLRTVLLVLSAAVGLVLLIACVNVANLLLGRAAGRQRELAVRAALGSGKSRLVRQLLTESMLIATAGAGVALVLAVAGIRYFNSTNLVELPPGNSVTMNLKVLAFTTFVASLAGLLSGLMPAFRMSQIDLNEMLKRTVGSGAAGNACASKLLVVAEVALSLILLATAGLLIESMVRLGVAPLGFRPAHLLTAGIALPPAAYSKPNQRSTFYEKVIAELSALPGVEGVALCSSLPPRGGLGASRLTIAGGPTTENIEAVNEEDVSAGYFRVLGVPLLQGREFDSRDREDSQGVAVVNQEIARTYFPREDAIGKQIKLGRAEDKFPWLTIVGIVGNEKRAIVYREMGFVDRPLVYRPVSQASRTMMEMAVRTATDALVMGSAVQREVLRLDSNVPVYDLKTMNERYAESFAHPRFRAIIMGALAGLALLLAAIGVYGVLAQLVSQRTREIGIRMALGAERRDVMRLVLRQGAQVTALGVIIGVFAAFSLTKFLAGMLFGVTPTDPGTFAAVIIVLLAMALAACYVPARRATRVDPQVALRHE
jgi:predicted permease